MTAPVESQVQQQPSDKELNFRALEAKYQKQVAEINAEKERLVRELEQRNQAHEEPEQDNNDFIDHKKLDKKLSKFNQSTQTEIQKAMMMAKEAAKEEMKQELFIEQNPDFYNVLQMAEKFAQKSPRLAETILRMPEGFDRQKLVYQSIKELGIDKPEPKQSTIQEKVDANRNSPYYQPSGVGAAPYAQVGDFTPVGMKNSYTKMQELKNRLRL